MAGPSKAGACHRAAIAPQVKVQAAKTKVEIAEYEQQVAACKESFQLEFWNYEAGPEGASPH